MNAITILIDALVLTATIVAILLLSFILSGTAQAIWLAPVVLIWLFDALVFIKRLE